MSDPEIGTVVETSGYRTNVHDQGEGKPVVLLHGSGAGVSAWANWRNLIPQAIGPLQSAGTSTLLVLDIQRSRRF